LELVDSKKIKKKYWRKIMAVKVLIISDKNPRLNYPAVSISAKQKRLILNQPAVLRLIEEYGTESQYVQILCDAEDNSGIFWVKLCDATSVGSRKLDSPSKSVRTCSISNLIEVLNWTTTETTRFEMTWDKHLKAGKVETDKPLVSEGSL
jgi:hypothetical protein